MQNENPMENTQVFPPADWLLDSPIDNQVESEEPILEEPIETIEENLSEHSESTEGETEEPVVVTETHDYTETLAEIKALQEQELATYTEINTTLHHLDQTVEYGVCMLIIVVIIILMNYAYKFFKMFF